MIQPKEITLDGERFYMQPLPLLRALCLDKKILTLIAPIVGSMDLSGISLDAEIEFDKIFESASTVLGKLSDEEFEKLVLDLLRSTLYIPEGETQQEITSKVLNTVFSGNLLLIYKLMFEVMRFNKFTPFAMAGGGNLTSKIGGFLNQKKIQKKNLKSSATSDSLLGS